MENLSEKINYSDVSDSKEKKPCKKCKAGNKVASTTLIIAMLGAFFMIYGVVSCIKDIIGLFTQ